jgi:uncharacterized protein (DUF2236 family)
VPGRPIDRTVAQRINGERLALLGWSRAILLQVAHPLVAAGVAEHSGFRTGPVAAARRLHGTVRAMLGLTFGSDEDRRRATDHILTIHRRVHGHLREPVGVFPAGTRYSAEDPALVLWVHATVLESTLLAYRAVVGDVTTVEADRYCAEAAMAAIDLGAEPDAVPRHSAALEDYLTSVQASGTLVVGADARIVAHHVLRGPLATIASPAGWLNRLATAAWLPPGLRAEYGLPCRGRSRSGLKRVGPTG